MLPSLQRQLLCARCGGHELTRNIWKAHLQHASLTIFLYCPLACLCPLCMCLCVLAATSSSQTKTKLHSPVASSATECESWHFSWLVSLIDKSPPKV